MNFISYFSMLLIIFNNSCFVRIAHVTVYLRWWIFTFAEKFTFFCFHVSLVFSLKRNWIFWKRYYLFLYAVYQCEHVLQTGTEIPHFDFLIFLCFEWGGVGGWGGCSPHSECWRIPLPISLNLIRYVSFCSILILPYLHLYLY